MRPGGRFSSALWILTLVVSLVAAACGSSGSPAAKPRESTPTTAVKVLGERGWLDGSPAEADRDFGGADGEMYSMADEGTGAVLERAADSPSSDVGDSIAAGEPGPETMPPEGPMPPDDIEPGPVDGTPLRAGSIDDNEDFKRYVAYLERFVELGLPVRALDVSVHHVVEVKGSDGRPAHGVAVDVLAGDKLIGSVRTGSDGRAYVHPRAMGAGAEVAITLRVGEVAQAPDAEGVTSFEIGAPGGASGPVPLDLFFVLDATGSMGDELARLTETVDIVAEKVAELPGDPDVRIGMTVYRDEGDSFVTRTFDFTSDVEGFRDALGEVAASGGGDYPEALDEALAAALDEPAWRDPADTLQLAFVIADAPPQVGREVAKPYDKSLIEAAERGIRIYPLAASGTDDQAEYVFRQLAQFTGAKFVFLSYGVGGAAVGPGTDISSLDDEQLPLEELLLRLVSDELANLVGEDAPPESTTTTIDQRQQQGD